MGKKFGVVHAKVGVIVGMDMGSNFFMSGIVLDSEGRRFDTGVRYPVIIALVKVFEVNVVAVGVLVPGFGGIIIYN